MMERFFQYSMEHTKPIRVLVDKNGKLSFQNIVVVTWNEDEIFFISPRKLDAGKPPRSLPRQAVLSADYVRGDHGDTLQFVPPTRE